MTPVVHNMHLKSMLRKNFLVFSKRMDFLGHHLSEVLLLHLAVGVLRHEGIKVLADLNKVKI